MTYSCDIKTDDFDREEMRGVLKMIFPQHFLFHKQIRDVWKAAYKAGYEAGYCNREE